MFRTVFVGILTILIQVTLLTSAGAQTDIAWSRTEKAYRYFGIEDVAFPGPLQSTIAKSFYDRLLPYLDPQKGLQVFSKFGQKRVLIYTEAKVKLTLETELHFDHAPTIDELRTSALAARPRPIFGGGPLQGMKIALDPGHMGDAKWDQLTGKYLIDAGGKKVSEGVLNLLTALTLESELTALGAEIHITHRGLSPVSLESVDAFDWKRFAHRAFQQLSLNPWFQDLAHKSISQDAFLSKLKADARVKKIYSASRRTEYFISGADLEARADSIDTFKPDLTLILHFDVVTTPANPHGPNPKSPRWTKAYIPGGYFAEEWASREDRDLGAQWMVDSARWIQSADVAKKIVDHISAKLDVPKQPTHGTSAVRVSEGVFARNLALTRKIRRGAVSYLELLFYSHPAEFQALSAKGSRNFTIDGKIYSVSPRMEKLVGAIRDGVVDYFTF